MALSFNPFTKKKKEDQIQGSGYTSAYASNPSNYSTASTYANSLSQGKGLPSITGQSLTVPSFQQKRQQVQNIVGQANNKIQGSGYTSQYASNPSNYKAPQATQQKQQTEQTSSVPSYIGGYQNLAEQKKALLDKQRQQGNEYYNKAYDERNRLLQESIPALQQQFLRTQANTQKGIDLNRQTAEYAKQNAQDQWGESQRLAAKTRQESEGRTRNKFAALGTTDSWGAGSYGQAQENVESDFNRFTQQGLRQKEQNMFEIDKELQTYEIEAQTKLDELNVELDTIERQIRSDITMNALDKQNALDELYNKYESAVMGVEEEMLGVYAQYDQALRDAKTNSLSFDDNGQPLNQASYEWMLNNPDEYKSAFSSGSGQSEATQGALTLVDELLDADTKGITGMPNVFGLLPGSSDQLLRNKYNQLKSMLSLENRQSLKGSGAISDYEAKVLEKAASSLGTNLNNADFKRVLREMKADLMNVPRESVQRPSLSSFES